MKKHIFLSLLGVTILVMGSIGGTLYAQTVDNSYAIIPELKDGDGKTGDAAIPKANELIETVGKTGGEVMKNYQEAYSGIKDDLAMQMVAGIMGRKTILDYVVYLVRFLSQIGLVFGSCMIIYAGYQYATSIFGGKTSNGNNAIKNAIIGVLVIVFAYAIMKLFTALFLGT